VNLVSEEKYYEVTRELCVMWNTSALVGEEGEEGLLNLEEFA